MQDAPPTLNSCIVPIACKKIKITKINVELNVCFPKKKHLVASQPVPLFTVLGLTTILFIFLSTVNLVQVIDRPKKGHDCPNYGLLHT